MIKDIYIKITFLLLFVAISLTVCAQTPSSTGSIHGFIYEKESGEPAVFTTIYLKGTKFGASSDVNGFYTISKVPPGNYFLTITTVGYDTLQTEIIIKADEVSSKQLFLKKSVINLKTIEVSAEKEIARSEVRISVSKITPKDIKSVPSIGGEPDLAQYLQVLPGVVFSGDQGGQLYIRGGTPVMNKVLLDGMIIYNPFHSIGLFSVFDTDILRNADVYTGGFSAEYGDRIGSVLDITTRDGNKKRYSGKISVGTFDAKVLLEGPILKQKSEGKGSSSFVVSYKNSYLDQSSKTFYKDVSPDGLPYSFSDLYGKISLNGQNGSKLNLFGFDFKDDANYRNIAKINWRSKGFGANFILVPGGSSTLIDGVFAFSQYAIAQKEANDVPRTSKVNGFNMDMNFTNFINRDEFKYGFEVEGFRTEYTASTITGLKNEQIENTTEFGMFFKYRISRDKIVIDPSIRLQYYASLAEFSPEPRLGIKWNVSKKLRLKFGTGIYSQNLIATSSDRDVVNLFYGFISGPDDLPKEFNGKSVKSKLQKARDVVVGAEIDLMPHLDLTVEAYYKKFTQLTNINRDKIYPDNGEYDNQPDYLVKTYIVEEGVAKGADVVLKYELKRIYFWAVYSLGYVNRYDGIRTYNPHFDRRHNMNLVASYTLGKKLDWVVNARWNYGSGFPFTKTAGFYEYLNFTNGLYATPTQDNGYLGIAYGELNKGRLPDYHRLDLGIKKTFVVGKNSNFEANFSLINVYNRQNIFYFDRVRYKRVNQLPTLYSLGVSLTF